MTLNLDELERIAKAALDKPWDRSGNDGDTIENLWSRAEGCVGGTEFCYPEDSEHISAFQPSTALELIRLARLGAWAEEVGIKALEHIEYDGCNGCPDFTDNALILHLEKEASEALARLPKGWGGEDGK